MKNIAVFQNLCIDIDQGKHLTNFCIEPITGDIYGYSEGFLYKININNPQLEEFINLHNEYELTSSFTVVGMNCNSVSQEVCLCFQGGDVITVNCLSKEVQCVGAVESGLKLMEWSPDQDVVAFVTGNETIIIMTGTFDPVAEVDFHQSSFGEKQFITVGWGKRETQFHGSEGKIAALQSADDNVVSPVKDDTQPRLSWRGDGTMFAVSMLNKDLSFRDIRIFGRDGILLYTALRTSGLEVALAWRPAGNLFASTHTLPNKQQVIFFEKNGLRHGEFTLSNQPGLLSVPLLAWNMDSSILAVWCINNVTGISFLKLWTCKNYHWYLKQKYVFGEEMKLKLLQWDAECSMRLHIVYGDLKYYRFDFVWTVNHSKIISSDSDGCVAVIDGAKLLVTEFCNVVIPPPMSQYTLQASDSINAVMFGPASLKNNMLIILSNGNVEMFKQDWLRNYNLFSLGPVKISEHYTILKRAWHELSHWLWLSEQYVLCCYPTHRSTTLVVMFINEGRHIETRKTVKVDGVIVSLVSSSDLNQAVIQLSNGSLMSFDIVNNTLLPCSESFPELCIQILPYDSTCGQKILGLSSQGKLYSDNTEIASGVTSLFLLPNFLLITNTKHALHCVTLANEICKLKGGRRIERGARLVVAVDTRVILQMPRGNLETITPRPLVIHVAAELLDRGRYKETFELLRQQRVNLNLLFDHNPQKFLSDVHHFVKDIRIPSWFSCFLLDLVSEDVTRTMYSEMYVQRSGNEVFPDKVSVVCDQIREVLKARNDSHFYLLPIITSHVRKGSDEDLAAALKEAKSNNKTISVDDALKHLLYMVDVNELYNIALGLYDFDLVMLVASKSTKDPKEYIPFLNNLRRMETNYQKYTIDKFLKRNKSALNHITQCPDNFDECLQFIKDHDLFSEGLQLLQKRTEQYQEVASAYGDYLMRNQCYYEASIMYQRGKNYSKALEASCIALDWQGALILMYELQYSEDKISEIGHRLVSSLINNKQFLDASNILIDHIKDIEEGINVLCQGHYWMNALRVACKYNLLDLIETCIKTGIMEYYFHLLNQLHNIRVQFETHKQRLAFVKQEREQKLKEQEAAEHHVDESDLFSDTTSVTETSARSSKSNSGYSVRSSQSSKNRRKHERKLLSLKEGSPHEDVALMQALHNEITACLVMRDDVKEVCKVLLRFDKDLEASTIQKLLTDVLKLMEKSTSDIWPVDRQTLGPNCVQNFGPDATTNSILSSLGHNSELNSRLLLLEPQLRYAPKFTGLPSWQLKTLEDL